MAVPFLRCHELGPAANHKLIGRAVEWGQRFESAKAPAQPDPRTEQGNRHAQLGRLQRSRANCTAQSQLRVTSDTWGD
ncbi:hypothetical protein GCM10010449_05770 [Streptomyces rectiviolaceus]|uniref:Uncharacterized protein n=1 Tax=Streptomyces rectiviolaceus TaxID=332591 RepID=A0ABP6M6X5_9ACTN